MPSSTKWVVLCLASVPFAVGGRAVLNNSLCGQRLFIDPAATSLAIMGVLVSWVASLVLLGDWLGTERTTRSPD